MYSVFQFLSGSTTPGQALYGLTVTVNITVHLEVPPSVFILLPAFAAREIATISARNLSQTNALLHCYVHY